MIRRPYEDQYQYDCSYLSFCDELIEKYELDYEFDFNFNFKDFVGAKNGSIFLLKIGNNYETVRLNYIHGIAETYYCFWKV